MPLLTLNFFTFVFQLSSVSTHYFRKKLSVCRRLNDFQDFEFCPQAEFSTNVCYGDRVLQSLNRVSKWRPATAAHRPSCPRITQRLLVVDITDLLAHNRLFVPVRQSVRNIDDR